MFGWQPSTTLLDIVVTGEMAGVGKSQEQSA
jgi:hypothetical protein